MTVSEQVEMSDAEIDAFLTDRHVAVLCVAREREPYAVPITYYYDEDDRRFYFRLIFPPGSDKRRFMTDRPLSRLVIYDESPPEYHSVIADGQPKEVRETDVDMDYVEQFSEMMKPLFEIWREPASDLDIELYEFEPSSITGRRIETSPDE